ncbi:MAG TPA: hypothetical protein VGG08_08300 [Solirubrobacteraceae bacterium]|jgi:hypothetical protein
MPFTIATTRNGFGEDIMTLTNDEAVCLEFYFQGYFKGEPYANTGGPEMGPGEHISFELPPELEGEPALMEFFPCGGKPGAAQIEALLKHDSFSEPFVAPEAGTATVQWSAPRQAARPPRRPSRCWWPAVA